MTWAPCPHGVRTREKKSLTCFTLVQRKYYLVVEFRPVGCGWFCFCLLLGCLCPFLHHLTVFPFLQ